MTKTIEAPRRKRRGIFDPILFIIFVPANPAASYGECARRIQRNKNLHTTEHSGYKFIILFK